MPGKNVTHVTKFNEENFFNGGGSPVRSFHNSFDTVRCANQRNVRATVSNAGLDDVVRAIDNCQVNS